VAFHARHKGLSQRWGCHWGPRVAGGAYGRSVLS